MISLAHNFELEIIAEGVEAAAQLEFLRELGCDQAQGYLFGKPARFDEVLEQLESPQFGAGDS